MHPADDPISWVSKIFVIHILRSITSYATSASQQTDSACADELEIASRRYPLEKGKIIIRYLDDEQLIANSCRFAGCACVKDMCKGGIDTR